MCPVLRDLGQCGYTSLNFRIKSLESHYLCEEGKVEINKWVTCTDVCKHISV